MSTRLLIADHHALVRHGIRAILERLNQLEVVAEADNGRDALGLIKVHRPDVAIMEVLMPELNGIDATAQAVARFPGIRVLILSVSEMPEHVIQAVHAGVTGYLSKKASAAELEQAIRAVAVGDRYFCGFASKHVVDGYLQCLGNKVPKWGGLKLRHREVLQLIAEGYTTKQIAAKLHLAIKTVEMYRTELMKKLNVHNLAHLVRHAVRMGMVSTDELPGQQDLIAR